MRRADSLTVIAAVGALLGSSTRSEADTALTTELVASGLSSPVFVTHAPSDFGRVFIVEQVGRILVMDLATSQVDVFLDITGRVGFSGERGLLGMAFHPNYAANGFFYVNYTDTDSIPNLDTHIARFQVVGDPASSDVADDTSEFTVMTYAQPFTNHNGGWIGFGPNDGYLYIASGDGGSGGDPGNRAQDTTNQRLGKILRIDVDGGSPYTIPPTNPFVGVTGDDEIWAYGLRNPWRCSFDRLTGDFYIADVGQNIIEEIDFQSANSPGGENWGWRCKEGSLNFDFDATCATQTLVDPIHEYSHGAPNFPCAVTGGVVYRGCAIPDLQGAYFFADYCSNQIWSFRGPTLSGFEERTTELDPAGPLGVSLISSFGEDAFGEIYLCDHGEGEVFKIVPVNAQITDCNGNGIDDACDIAIGASADVDRDGIPDELGCNDADPCIWDGCDGNGCLHEPSVYGDVDHNGFITLADLFCVLDGFAGDFSTCSFHDDDVEPCGGNDVINILDLFAVLDAFGGDDGCCGG